MTNAKEFMIPEPVQNPRMGGWFGKVLNRENSEPLFETLQPSKVMAFIECVWWVHREAAYIQSLPPEPDLSTTSACPSSTGESTPNV